MIGTIREPARPPRRRGLALLMVLVLLVTLSSALTLQTRTAMGRSMAVDARALAVQQDWALRSVAATMAPQAPRLLGQAPTTGARRRPRGLRPRATWNGTVRLGPVVVAVVLTDEQAKLNLHALEPDAAAAALVKLMGPDAAAQHVRLRPLRSVVSDDAQDEDAFDDEQGDSDGDGASESESEFEAESDFNGQLGAGGETSAPVLIQPGRFAGYGQVLNRPRPGPMLGRGGRDGLVTHWGLWGPGSLHYATATPAALRAALDDELPPEAVDALLKVRRRGGRLEDAIAAAQRVLTTVGGSEDADAQDGFDDDFEDELGFGDEFDEDGVPGLPGDSPDDFSDDSDDEALEEGQDQGQGDWRRWLTDKSETQGLWLVASAPGRPAGPGPAAFYVIGPERKLQRVHQW